jgi:hypothetical protein
VKRKRKKDILILNMAMFVNLFLFIFYPEAIISEDQRRDAPMCGGYVLKHSGSSLQQLCSSSEWDGVPVKTLQHSGQ